MSSSSFFRTAFSQLRQHGARWGTLSAVVAVSAIGIVQVSSSGPDAPGKYVSFPDPSKFPRIPSREENLAKLKDVKNKFDVLIIGGGATGAGAALDAASRGLKVALVERDDFSCGTSSRSTKLVHGGVRYLEKAIRVLSCPRRSDGLGTRLRTIQIGERSPSREKDILGNCTAFNLPSSYYGCH
jgi:FAD dependent oxidoreductase